MANGFLYYLISLPVPCSSYSELSSSTQNTFLPKDYSSLLSTATASIQSKNKEEIYEKVYEHIQQYNKSIEVKNIEMPEFKIGSLDVLIGLSDELLLLDGQIEGVAHRLFSNLQTLLSVGHVSLSIDTLLTIDNKKIDDFVSNSKWWNDAKIQSNEPLNDIVSRISHEIFQIDTNVKVKMNLYNQLKTNIALIERKNTGNLSVKSLVGVLKAEDILQNSEYLETLFVAVPMNLQSEWLDSYETLTPMVVPRSSKLIAKDDEYVLYSVLVFQKIAVEFKLKAKEMKFIVRDFSFNPEEVDRERQEQEKSTVELKEQWTQLIIYIKTNFGEVFSSWLQLKLIRVFVEGVLRYGLPPIYVNILVKSTKHNSDKKLLSYFSEIIKKMELPISSRNAIKDKNIKSSTSKTENFIAEGINPDLTSVDYISYVLIDIKWSF